MNNQRITIIVYKTGDKAIQELANSLKDIAIPVGYSADFMFTMAHSKWSAYNELMNKTDAKYKLYLDENVEIVNKNFLVELINIFNSDKNIGVIGCAGAKILSTHGICHTSEQRCGKLFFGAEKNLADWSNQNEVYSTAEAIDGYFMATQYDITWREDIFKGDSFGDTAQCIEFKRAGYKIVVANQNDAWIWYKTTNFAYDENSYNTFLNEYSTDIFPKVSILIPTYNRPEFFPTALESAMSQTYRNIEIIVSDDSNNEETKKIFESRYLGKDSRLQYYYNTGFTAADNHNFLCDKIDPKSEYVNFLYDDDIFYPKKIELMVEAYRNNPDVTLVTSTKNLIDENGQFITRAPSNMNETKKYPGEFMGWLLFMSDDFIGTPVTVLVKREYFEGCWRKRNFKIRGAADVYAWFHLLEYGNLFWFADPLSAHREHPGEGTYDNLTNVVIAIDWARCIKYYWEKKLFLKTQQDFRGAIVQLISGHCMGALRTIYEKDIQDKMIPVFQEVLIELAKAFADGNEINLPEDPESSIDSFYG